MHPTKTLQTMVLFLAGTLLLAADTQSLQYRVLSTKKTSTMETEMNEAAQAGFSFVSVMGGETVFGGKEVVITMARASGPPEKKSYKLLAANKTSTIERELQAAADEGFNYKGQTIFDATMGGRELALIMERDPAKETKSYQYKLLATAKTSTMQKELDEIGAAGFQLLGMTVAKTAFGGAEIVCILRK